jgi:outer membrane protein OmpA-like peptidoglycan-associated protein
MIARRAFTNHHGAEEAEKPFWISFADLMTALMVLFLVSLSVALADANRQKDEAIQAKQQLDLERNKLAQALAELQRRDQERDTRRERRSAELQHFLDAVATIVQRHDGVSFDRDRLVVNFGSRALFRHGRHDLTPDQINVLRKLVPELLGIARSTTGQRWLKRVIVEGFTDETGTYLYNLNLSLQRSQRVLCVLLAKEWPQALTSLLTRAPDSPGRQKIAPVLELYPVTPEDESSIRALFLVGGYSSNSTKQTAEDSRRIELRIEFFELDEAPTQRIAPVKAALRSSG